MAGDMLNPDEIEALLGAAKRGESLDDVGSAPASEEPDSRSLTDDHVTRIFEACQAN